MGQSGLVTPASRYCPADGSVATGSLLPNEKEGVVIMSERKPDYTITPRRIVCAAMFKEGRIIAGARHFDKIMRRQMVASEGIAWWKSCQQGFIDQFGDFINREEAWNIAEDQGQIRMVSGTAGTLYSEDLY